MTDDPLRTYVNAKRQLDGAKAQADAYAGMIQNVGKILANDPLKLGFPGVSSSFSVINNQLIHLEPEAWPTHQQLVECVQLYDQAVTQFRRAEDALPASDRKDLGIR